MKKNTIPSSVVVYRAKNGAIELRGDVRAETVWATQAQIAEVFGVERSVVTKHINNLLKSGEIFEKSNVQKMHIAKSKKLDYESRFSNEISVIRKFRVCAKFAHTKTIHGVLEYLQ